MPISGRVFSLFLAGARDVADEQAIVGQIVDAWNREHGLQRSVFVTVTSWATHTYPEGGVRPQAAINRQVLDAADIVVAVFWTRFGTPTSESASGTEEEIDRSISAGKRVLVYFSDRPISPSAIDHVQHEKVETYRERYRTLGLYSSYTDLDVFRDAFRTHLALLMNELCESEAQPITEHQQTTKEAIAITLSPDYWVIVLAALERAVQNSQRIGAELAARGISPENVSDADRTALAAPILIRGFVIDVLVKHGIMRPEASSQLGYEATLRAAGYSDPSKDPGGN
jgi:hypothetical protein